MTTNWVSGTWEIVWEFLGWFQICAFIYPWEEGILTRRGRFKRCVGGDVKHFLGVAWHLPLEIDEITVMNVKPTAMELQEQSLTTKDNKKIVCRGVLMWGIFDIKKAIIDVEDVEYTLGDIAVGVIQAKVKQRSWDYVCSPKFLTELKKAIQNQAREWGITVSTVKFQDLVLADSYRVFGGLVTP